MNANNLKKYREKMGYSQSELAKITKIPQTTISSWEHGIGEPTYSRAILIAKKLNTPPEKIFGK